MLTNDMKDSVTGAVLLMQNFSKLCAVLCYTFYWFSGGGGDLVPSTKIQAASKVYKSTRPQLTYFECHRC
jgi:hypothetical protein